MRRIDYIVIHCTATPQSTTLDSIRRYWRDTLRWKSPGYHFVVHPNGVITQLSDIAHPTNGVQGYNAHSIHISYIGGIDSKGNALDNRTEAQKKAIRCKLRELRKQYPKAKIQGHRDFSLDKNKNGKIDAWEYTKMCPCFDAIPEYSHI